MKKALSVLGAVFLILAGGIACSVLVVWVYSAFLAPGRPMTDYQAFAQASAPVVSVIAGPLVTYLAIRLLVRKSQGREALLLAAFAMGLYALLDLSVLVMSRPSPGVWGLAALSLSLRVAAAWAAAASRRAEPGQSKPL